MLRILLQKKVAHAAILFLFTAAGFSLVQSAKAQVADVYLQGGVSHTTFLRKGDIQIDKSLLSPILGAGLSFYINDKQLWKVKTEIQYLSRDYKTYYPHSEFRYRTWGIEINALAEYPFSDRFSAEAGIGVYLYGSVLLENGRTKRLGDQSKTVDLNLIAGVNYQIYKPVFIGFRSALGLIPMMSTKPVGKYGEMDGKKQLLNALTPELFLRVKLYRRDKE